MSLLVEHITAMRQRFIAEHGKEPTILALGRWDARELAVYAARNRVALPQMSPRMFFRVARDGAQVWGAQVKVDGRVGRMPGGLWWHADRRH